MCNYKQEQAHVAVAQFLVCSIIILQLKLLWNKNGKVQLRRVHVVAYSTLVITDIFGWNKVNNDY